MGLTIQSTKHSCDMGYGGFKRFRQDVAKAVGEKMHAHYIMLDAAPSWPNRERFFEEYDKQTRQLVESGVVSDAVAAFLYARDSDGKCDRQQVKEVAKLLESIPDEESYGYCGRSGCATARDLKLVFSGRCNVTWR